MTAPPGARHPLLDRLHRLTRQPHLVAMRDGIISIMPIILVGSTFLLLGAQKDVVRLLVAQHPDLGRWGLVTWYLEHAAQLLIPYRLTMQMLSLYVAFTVGASLASQYHLPPVPQGMASVATFMMTTMPRSIDFYGGARALDLPLTSTPFAHSPLGAEGMFLAIGCALGTVELARIILRPSAADAARRQSEDATGVPLAVGDAFRTFAPMLISVTIVWLLRHVLGLDLVDLVITGLHPLEALGDSLMAVLLINLVLHLLQFAGVHGVSVINAIFMTFWQAWLIQNAEAHLAGQALPHISAYPFFQWFIWIGGAGATLPLALLLLVSRQPHARRIGRMAIVPSLFNVNEPLLFGLPVVLNPTLLVPFIAAPLVSGLLAWLAMHSNLVGRPFLEVPWVLPCFIGAPLATGDARALILLAVNLGVGLAIWLPFLRTYEVALQERTSVHDMC
jgi:cellobiose PTS system EIIC component